MSLESGEPRVELRFIHSTSRKFWRVEAAWASAWPKARLTITWGRIGTAGQSIFKEFDSETEARRAGDQLIDGKLRKGYHRFTPPTPDALTGALTGAGAALAELGGEAGVASVAFAQIAKVMESFGMNIEDEMLHGKTRPRRGAKSEPAAPEPAPEVSRRRFKL